MQLIHCENCICFSQFFNKLFFQFFSRNATCPICRTPVDRRNGLFELRPCRVVLRRITINGNSGNQGNTAVARPVRRSSVDEVAARRRPVREVAPIEPRTPTRRSRRQTTRFAHEIVSCIICGKQFCSTKDQIFCSLVCRKAVE